MCSWQGIFEEAGSSFCYPSNPITKEVAAFIVLSIMGEGAKSRQVISTFLTAAYMCIILWGSHFEPHLSILSKQVAMISLEYSLPTLFQQQHVRVAPLVLSMWPCKRKLNEEKSKHAGLAQHNGFGPAFLHRMLRLVKGTTKPNTCCWLTR
jgi:hypothetical protein